MNLTEAFEVLLKGRKMDVGTISTRANGVQYQKQGDGKWVEYRNGGYIERKKDKTLDLKGNKKELFMYEVGDFSHFKPFSGKKQKVKFNVGEIDVAFDGKKYIAYDNDYGTRMDSEDTLEKLIEGMNSAFIDFGIYDMEGVKKFAEESAISEQEQAIKEADSNGLFSDSIENGKIFYEQAIAILQSAKIKNPKDTGVEFFNPNSKISNYAKDYRKSKIQTKSNISKNDIYKYMAVSGIPKGFDGVVNFDESGDIVNLSIENSNLYITRSIYTSGINKGVILNNVFKIKNTNIYNGTNILYNQVKNAQKEGFNSMKAFAYRAKGWNGYYTWLRLGYEPNEQTDEEYIKKANKELGTNISSITELMYSKEGREWWKENGGSFEGTFDLSENSYSMKTLEEYVKNKNK
jgi:hypothetical protein